MRLLKQAALFAVLFIGLAFGIISLAPIAVFAQDVLAVPADGPTFLQQIVAAVLPALGVLISAILLYGASLLKAKTGIDIEARHREALQSALMNGILFALQRAGWVAGDKITPAIMTTARSYVESSVPDALKQFGIDPITDTGKAVLDRLLTPKLPVPPGTVMPNGDTLVGRVK